MSAKSDEDLSDGLGGKISGGLSILCPFSTGEMVTVAICFTSRMKNYPFPVNYFKTFMYFIVFFLDKVECNCEVENEK